MKNAALRCRLGLAVVLVSACAFGVRAETWSGTKSFDADATITDAVTLDGTVEVTVASGKTVTLQGTVSDGSSAGRIVLLGGGTLQLVRANTFRGGAYVDTGRLQVLTGGALGTGVVTVKGGTDAMSQLQFGPLDAAATTAATITFANDLVIENAGDATHYQIVFGPHGENGKRQSLKLTGALTSAGDLYFSVDSAKQYTSTGSGLKLTLADVTVAGGFHFDRATVATTFAGKVDCDSIAWTATGGATMTFNSSENRFGRLDAFGASIVCGANNVLGGAALISTVEKGSNVARLSLAGYSQGLAYLELPAATSWIKSSAAGTLTLTGGTASSCCMGALQEKLALTLDAGNADFVQTFSGATHTLTGPITVKEGTLRFDGATTLANVADLAVEGGRFVLDTTADDPLASLGTVSLKTGAFLDLGARTVSVRICTVDGEAVTGRDLTHENYPGLIAEGTVIRPPAAEPIVYTTADMTASGDWHVDVIEGFSNVVTGVQSGSGKIVKTGRGWLVLKSENTFTGGIELREGRLTVDPAKEPAEDGKVVTTALGGGTLTIGGQTADFDGYCHLEIIGAGPNDTRVVTIANDIRVTGNTTKDRPALMVFGQNSVLTGRITADRDFVFYEDYDSTEAIHSGKYDRYSYVTALTFGAVEAAGMIGTEGYVKFVFAGQVKTPLLDLTLNRPKTLTSGNAPVSENNAHLAVELRSPGNEIGQIVNSKHPIACEVANAFAGAILDWESPQLSVGVYGNYNLRGYDQTIAGLQSQEISLAQANKGLDGTANTGYEFQLGSSTASETLTITGVAPDQGETEKELVACSMIGYWGMYKDGLSLVLDAYPGFTQTFKNRLNPMAGSITVKRGTFRMTGTSTFFQTPTITVEANGTFLNESTTNQSLKAVKTLTVAGRFELSGSATDALPSLETLDLADGCALVLPNTTELTVKNLKLNGTTVPAGTWTHDILPTIPTGLTVTATSGDWPEAETTETWIGGAADTLMETRGNWQGEPETLDLVSGTLKAVLADGTEMTYADGTQVNAIENEMCWTNEAGVVAAPFVIGPAAEGGALTVVRRLESLGKRQLVLRGHLKTPYGVRQGDLDALRLEYSPVLYGELLDEAVKASGVIRDNTRSLPLVLDGAVIDKHVVLRPPAASTTLLLANAQTTNVINGHVSSYAYQSYVSALEGGVLEFRGGITGSTSSLLFAGEGEIRIVDEPYVNNYYTKVGDAKCTLVLDAEDCSLGGNANGEGFCVNSGRIEFRRSGCLAPGVALSFGNATMRAEAEFHSTTQRIGRVGFVNTHAKSFVHGDYPAMVEADGAARAGATYFDAKAPNIIDRVTAPVTGGLGFHVCGDYTLTLSGRAFESCGDLEASAGTLVLDADATWRNGTNVTARGTGGIRFLGDRQLGTDAVLTIDDDGQVEIADGKTLKVGECRVNGAEVTTGEYTAAVLKPGDPLYGHLAGGGVLRVGKFGIMLIVR